MFFYLFGIFSFIFISSTLFYLLNAIIFNGIKIYNKIVFYFYFIILLYFSYLYINLLNSIQMKIFIMRFNYLAVPYFSIIKWRVLKTLFWGQFKIITNGSYCYPKRFTEAFQEVQIPNCLSIRRTTPIMPSWNWKNLVRPFLSARMVSKPLIVA